MRTATIAHPIGKTSRKLDSRSADEYSLFIVEIP